MRIHLSGPLSGCNEPQRRLWRAEFKKLCHEFEYSDPADWADYWDFSRGLRAVEECDLVVANMWKESIGTTLEIMRARSRGRPVILVDPNHLENKVLEGLVAPEKPVPDLRKAAARVRELAETVAPFDVLKKDGSFEPFSWLKLMRSIKLTFGDAGIVDVEFPNQIMGPVVMRLTAAAKTRIVSTEDIQAQVFEELDRVTEQASERAFTRDAAEAVKETWRRREEGKRGEARIQAATRRIAELENKLREAEQTINELHRLMAEQKVRLAELDRNPISVRPVPDSVVAALQEVKEDFRDCVVVLDRALKSAENSPFADPAKALIALRLLGTCARERMLARLNEERFVGTKEWFEHHRDEAPWLTYAPHESQTARTMYAVERTVLHEGDPLLMQQHLKIGAGGPASTLRVYFTYDEQDCAVIGHCGRHPTNTKS